MSNVKIDIPDITVVVNPGDAYSVDVVNPQVIVDTEDNYMSVADYASQANSASFAVTASYASNATLPPGIVSGSNQVILNQITGTTFSSSNFTFPQNLTVDGALFAESLFVSSSTIYDSGSTKFGDSLDDTHQFTGSVLVDGQLYAPSITGSFIGDGSQITGIATVLSISGSTAGSDTVNLKTDALTFSGSNNVTATVSNNTVIIGVTQLVSQSAQINTGSFAGTLIGTSSWAQRSVSSTFVQNSAPSNPLEGMLWWDEDSAKLFVYYDDGSSAQWVQALPDILSEGPVGTFTLGGNLIISGDTTVQGTLFETSDVRLKTNIKEISNGLSLVEQLRAVEFDWIWSDQHSYGVIAQEVEKHFPFLVNTTKTDGAKTVNYTALIGILIQAVKELTAKVDTLEKDRG